MPEPRNRNIFLAIFGLLFAIGTGLAVWRGPREGAEGWVDQVLSIWGELAPLAAVAIVGAAFLTEIVRWIMVIAGWLEEKLERTREARRAEGRAEGVAEGIARANRDWEEWNRRREAALERGEPFSEPPPSRNGARP